MENDRPSHGFVAGDGEVRGWESSREDEGGGLSLRFINGG